MILHLYHFTKYIYGCSFSSTFGFEGKATSTFIINYSFLFSWYQFSQYLKCIIVFKDQQRNYVSVSNLIQEFWSYHYRCRRLSLFITDKTFCSDRNHCFGLWFYMKPIYETIIHMPTKYQICFLLKKSLHQRLKNMKNTAYIDGCKWLQ